MKILFGIGPRSVVNFLNGEPVTFDGPTGGITIEEDVSKLVFGTYKDLPEGAPTVQIKNLESSFEQYNKIIAKNPDILSPHHSSGGSN
ncbi:hypothetical protein D4R99_02920 [bacterium]|nr:MAG: hypothetical protein D4R99_02920 [bacterium]